MVKSWETKMAELVCDIATYRHKLSIGWYQEDEEREDEEREDVKDLQKRFKELIYYEEDED